MKICEIVNSAYDKHDKELEKKVQKVVCDALEELKELDKECYHEYKDELYVLVYGCHFTKDTYERAVKKMENEDGSKGEHWTVSQINDVLKQYSVSIPNYNEYDIAYIMNMYYSDYYPMFNNDVTSYVKLTKHFLMDKDSKDGKAYKYYKSLARK